MKKSELRQLIREEIKILNEDKSQNISVKKAKNKEELDEIAESEKAAIDNGLELYFKKLVPMKGAAETIEGETVRAMMRILYRYFNDGDFYFRGYGKETVLPSVKWLVKHPEIGAKLKTIFNNAKANAPKKIGQHDYAGQFSEEDGYQDGIYDAAKLVIHYVKSKSGKYSKNDSEDSR